jgi:4,5-DOPA dioxygenase extradiol
MSGSIPSLFVSHGSPMLALEEEPTAVFLRGLAKTLPRPSAIIVASAHYEADIMTITGSPTPPTIHDFHGFPDALYAARYPAPGDPALARRMEELLKGGREAARIDPARGLDHGAWSPLLLMYPQADIPVVEISVAPHRDARWHYHIGRLLAPLREEGILILGTGNLTHNLREAMRGHHASAPGWVSEFAQWVAENTENGNVEALLQWETLAPHAHRNHPTAEHFLPFFVALGAAGDSFHATRLHQETTLGVLAMDAYAF